MHINEYIVRYSETGESMKATLPAVISYFQDTSISHSSAVGQSVEYLLSKQLAWILAGWHINISRYPSHGEKLIVKTCSTGFKNMYGYRIFIMEDENGEVIATASSVWIFYNFKEMKFKKVDPQEAASFGSEDYTLFEDDRSYRLTKKASYSFHSEVIVKKSDIDTNGHANNISYIKYISNAFPELEIFDLRIQYKKQAMLGDKIEIHYNFDDDRKNVLLTDENGDVFVIAEF